MRILFDQGTPAQLRRHLIAHDVVTAHERGWHVLRNGDLLTEAETAGFEVIVTTDQSLRCQQNFSGRRLAIVVLPPPIGVAFGSIRSSSPLRWRRSRQES